MKLWRKPFDAVEKAPKPAKVHINRERCKGCGYCVEFCPRGALKMSGELNTKGYDTAMVTDETKCLGCGLCEIICPEFGIHLSSDEKKE